MDPTTRPRTRRTPGAVNALWLTVLVLSLGLFGSGADYLESGQSPTTGFSGALDPVVGAPSSTELRALPNWLRQSVEGESDSELSFAANSASLKGDELFSRFTGYFSPAGCQTSRHQSDPSPRAPPLV